MTRSLCGPVARWLGLPSRPPTPAPTPAPAPTRFPLRAGLTLAGAMSAFVDLASRRWAHVELYNCRSFVRELAALLAAGGEACVAEAFDNVYRFVVLEREVHGDRLRG